MDFSLTEEQEMLRTSARDFLLKECPKSRVKELEEDDKGYDPAIWQQLADLGWTGLVIPEQYGGSGGAFLDLAVLLEEMGKSILPAPFFSTIALCTLPILEFGTQEQKDMFLPDIAKGKTILALALTEPSATYKASGIELRATSSGQEYTLNGTKLFVTYANVADHLLVAARTSDSSNPQEGITVFLIDTKRAGVKIEVTPTIATDKQCEVQFDNVVVSNKDILGEPDNGWKIVDFILQRATVLKCAEILGASQATLDMSASYARERVQFDKPIGSFQAIQHKLADMMIDVEGARYLTYETAWQISEGRTPLLEISVAKAKANEVYERACIEGIQIHGAIGFTRDHDIGLYYRRVKAAQFAMGDGDFHREKIATALGL